MEKPGKYTNFHAADRDTGAAMTFNVISEKYVDWLEARAIGEHFIEQNKKRALRWHNGDLSNWSPAEWGNAIAGEVGEFCNIAKKILRASENMQQRTVNESKLISNAAEELADVVTYCVVTAAAMGIDLNAALRDKFNAISEREGFPERV